MNKEIDEKTLRKAYMHTFNSPSGQLVLLDLSNRCFKRSSTEDGSDIKINEGRRQVLLHIESMMSAEGIEILGEPEEGGNDVSI